MKNAEHFIKSIKTDKEYKEDGWHGYYNKEIVELARILQHILSDYKRVLKENKKLKEYIAIAPNLDEMTATKYRNIQQDAYIQGRAEEQQKAEQIIYENYISKQKIKDIIDRIDYDIKKTKEIISNDLNIYTSNRRNDYQIVRLRAMNTKSLDIKKRLQKLLESEE